MSNFFDFEDGKGLVPYTFHPNGGGKVATTATVDPTVFVGAGCLVFGKARVKGNVQITGRVRVGGDDFPFDVSTLIEDDVKISGNVQISGCVLLRDHADIRDNVILEGCVRVMHHARVYGGAHLNGWVSVMDSAYVCGSVKLTGTSEELVVRGEAYLREGVIARESELSSAVRKDQLRQDGTFRKKAVKA